MSNQATSTVWKTIFSFSKCSEKIIFPKKSHWNMIFLVSSGKMTFFPPENMILFFRRKIKDDLSQKNAWKYDIFFKCSGKMVFPKKLHWNIVFFTSWGKMAFFPPKIWYFFRDRKWKMVFFKKQMEIWCFLYVDKGGISFSYKYEITLLSKKQRRFFPEKYT